MYSIVISSSCARFVVSSNARSVPSSFARFVISSSICFVVSSCARLVVFFYARFDTSSFTRFVVSSCARFVVSSYTPFVVSFCTRSSSDSSYIFNSPNIQTSFVRWVFAPPFNQTCRASLSISNSRPIAQKSKHKWLFDTTFINSHLLAGNNTVKEVNLSIRECGCLIPVKLN